MIKKIIGVCACPAGIAHTYLAAESLEKAAKAAGLECKIETDGAGGIENELTKKDIKNADAVIVAADTVVEMDRFIGKPLMEISVSEVVRNGEKVIEKLLNEELEVYE